MIQYPETIAKLIASYSKLPGIGQKTATRLAMYTLEMSEEDVKDFSDALASVKRDIIKCDVCGMITDKENNPCVICQDTSRNQDIVFVVEHSKDVMAMEKTNDYDGLYHVLDGVISPSSGKGPDDINLHSLINRLAKNPEIKEVILGTNASTEGETTALYIGKLLKPAGIKVTRLAHGLSVGSDIDYADQLTLIKAVEGRTEL